MSDVHQETADQLGIPRENAKAINYMDLYGAEKIKLPGGEGVLISTEVFERIEIAALIAASTQDTSFSRTNRAVRHLLDRSRGEGMDNFGCLMAINRYLNDGIPAVDVKDKT